MENKVRSKRGLIMTVVFALIIVTLAGLAFLPTIMNRRTDAAVGVYSASSVDAEAVRILGCCNAYAAANDFKTTLNGSVKARVMNIPYTQKVHGGRTRHGDDFSEVAESTSALVKAAVKRERSNGDYYVTRGEYKSKSFNYGAPKKLSRDDYAAAYGQPFTGVVKYCLDSSIVSARKVNDNTYTFTLDPARSTTHCKNEVKTMLGGKSYPKYKSVEFTLTVDGDRPVKVKSTEKFVIDKFGGTECTATYTEVFSFDK